MAIWLQWSFVRQAVWQSPLRPFSLGAFARRTEHTRQPISPANTLRAASSRVADLRIRSQPNCQMDKAIRPDGRITAAIGHSAAALRADVYFGGIAAMHSISTFAFGTTSAAITTVDRAGGESGKNSR